MGGLLGGGAAGSHRRTEAVLMCVCVVLRSVWCWLTANIRPTRRHLGAGANGFTGAGDAGGTADRFLLGNVEQTAFFVGWYRHICACIAFKHFRSG